MEGVRERGGVNAGRQKQRGVLSNCRQKTPPTNPPDDPRFGAETMLTRVGGTEGE